MPTDQYFSVEVLVGKCSIPEYSKNDNIYVESNLFTPVSYSQSVSEVVNGETETQNVPVTPYMIRIAACGPVLPEGFSYYFRVMVDGVKVKGVSLTPGEHKLIKGFRDGRVVRELLFSMPRNSKNKDEKLDELKVPRIGKIEVECWKAQLLERSWELRQTALNFQQASKHDSLEVTKGKLFLQVIKGSYTMATSKAGRELYQRRIFRSVDQWKRVLLLSRQSIHYHMGHTLQAMGITLTPYPVMALAAMPLPDKIKLGVKSEEEKEEKEQEEVSSSPPRVTASLRRQRLQPLEDMLLGSVHQPQGPSKKRAKRTPAAATASTTGQPMDSESFVTSQTKEIVSAKPSSSQHRTEVNTVKAEEEDVVTLNQEGVMGQQEHRNNDSDIMNEDDKDEIEILQVVNKVGQSGDVIDLT